MIKVFDDDIEIPDDEYDRLVKIVGDFRKKETDSFFNREEGEEYFLIGTFRYIPEFLKLERCQRYRDECWRKFQDAISGE